MLSNLYGNLIGKAVGAVKNKPLSTPLHLLMLPRTPHRIRHSNTNLPCNLLTKIMLKEYKNMTQALFSQPYSPCTCKNVSQPEIQFLSYLSMTDQTFSWILSLSFYLHLQNEKHVKFWIFLFLFYFCRSRLQILASKFHFFFSFGTFLLCHGCLLRSLGWYGTSKTAFYSPHPPPPAIISKSIKSSRKPAVAIMSSVNINKHSQVWHLECNTL